MLQAVPKLNGRHTETPSAQVDSAYEAYKPAAPAGAGLVAPVSTKEAAPAEPQDAADEDEDDEAEDTSEGTSTPRHARLAWWQVASLVPPAPGAAGARHAASLRRAPRAALA